VATGHIGHKFQLTTVIFCQDVIDHKARICITLNYFLHYTLYLLQPSWMNKSCFNSFLYVISLPNCNQYKHYNHNYMQLPYQFHFGVLFWYTLVLQQNWTSVCSQDDCTIGWSTNGPCSQPLAMCPYAASVKWIPSQLQCVLGSEHAEAPGSPHFAVRLKL
jgi:hypothetical protein